MTNVRLKNQQKKEKKTGGKKEQTYITDHSGGTDISPARRGEKKPPVIETISSCKSTDKHLKADSCLCLGK